MTDSFSILIPVYNSSKSLSILCTNIIQELLGFETEIILVDDGSEKGTWDEIVKIKVKFGIKIIGLRLGKNFGQHNATLCGLNCFNNNFVVTIDDDLQFSSESILDLNKKISTQSHDLGYGLPKNKLLQR